MNATAERLSVADLLILTKLRVNLLVVATTAGGYLMARRGPLDLAALAIACAATYFVASGAATLNQVSEQDVDRLMVRTRNRPVAAQRMGTREASVIGFLLGFVGLFMLWIGFGPAPALVALATFASYVWMYTPLKRVTSLSTIVGAVPGALPPLIGWAAAGGSLSELAPWALFFIGFVWQMPHILAIGWMYREDYARANLPIVASIDATGAMSGRQAVVWSAALVPISVLPAALHMTGLPYVIGALVLGVAQFWMAVAFARDRSRQNAKRLFYATLIYLPLMWILLIATRT